ncbi:MAG: Phosphoribosylformylglycinamidine synthase subunit PurQ [Firmicutes bacterium]|nr:Phosphoribosylformylglycinamidine synthase subunit PurQ [Bacillota bacterium]
MKAALDRFISDGNLIIGICNGFQAMSRLGLLPALDKKYFVQEIALVRNDSGLFRDDWTHLKANPLSPCVFTKGLGFFRLPVRHGEGKLVAKKDVLKKIASENLVALQYCDESGDVSAGFPFNPNGSIMNIAGICDETGRIFGLMPHPEAYLSPYNAPDWTAKKLQSALAKNGDGMKIFSNAVRYAKHTQR